MFGPRMSGRRMSCATATMILLSIGAIVDAQDSARQSQRFDEHAHARALANELVTTVFDMQLRHLEANGLADLPVYAEIRTSRDNIAQLGSTEMQVLTQLLQTLQNQDAGRRNELLTETRTLARHIAVAMMAERQRLRGRLRASQTMILLRQMIALERQAIVAAEGLKSQPDSDRPRHTEQLVQSHLDLAVLFDQLMTTLRQAKETVGQDRLGAAAAVEHLTNEQTSVRIADAVELFRSNRYEDARQCEQRILGALEEAQRLVQAGDKLEEEARRKALAAITDTMREQQDVLRKTESTELLDVAERDDLVARQRRIAEQLEELREPLSQLAQVGEQMLAASDAALDATKHLGEGKKDQAIERQATVLNMLHDIAQHLNAETLDPDALADRAARLEELSASLSELVEKQVEAGELAASDPDAAAELEQEIADSLEEADDASQLSGEVEARLDEAQEAVKKAQQALEDDAPSAEQHRLEAVDSAEQALLEAAAEVQSQLADTQQAMESANPAETNAASDSASKNEASTGTTRDAGSTSVAEEAAAVESRNFENAAWFARLPAELQNRIRAATRRPPPRGYETRLQRYFQSAD